MSRKEPDNFYRRQLDEANRIATKQHRVLADIAKLAKSSNEELRKMRRAFEAFSEAVLAMKIEPFQTDALTMAGYRPPAHDDEPGAFTKSQVSLPPKVDPSPEVVMAISKCKSLEPASIETHTQGLVCFYCPPVNRTLAGTARAQRPAVSLEDIKSVGEAGKTFREYMAGNERLGYGDVAARKSAGPISGSAAEQAAYDAIIDEAELAVARGEEPEDMPPHLFELELEVKLDADGYLVPGTLPLEPSEDIPVTQNGKEVGRANVHADGTADIEFLYPSTPEEQAEEECADVSAARRTGGYTGTAPGQLAGVVHQAEGQPYPRIEISNAGQSPMDYTLSHLSRQARAARQQQNGGA